MACGLPSLYDMQPARTSLIQGPSGRDLLELDTYFMLTYSCVNHPDRQWRAHENPNDAVSR
jgi:hypothetical protein